MNHIGLVAVTVAQHLGRRWDQPTPVDWADVLARFPLFTGVRKRRLRKLARNATLVEFAPGETIVVVGDPADVLYVILGGNVAAISPAGRQALHTGDYFGELAVIDGRPRSATVVATSDVHVMKLPARSVMKLARRHPAMTLTMLRDLSTRLRRLEAVGARSAAEA